MCFLKDALFGFLTLIVTLSSDEGVTCKPVHDHSPIINLIGNPEDSDDYLTPLLRELKILRSHLEQKTSKNLSRIYGNNVKQMKADNLKAIEHRLKNVTSTSQLLRRIYRLLHIYQCKLQKMQEYVLKTDGDFSQQIKERRNIFKDLEDYLSLALIEVKNILENKTIRVGCRINLIAVFTAGDFGTMKTMDNHFVEHLKSFLDIAIISVQNRQLIEQAYIVSDVLN